MEMYLQSFGELLTKFHNGKKAFLSLCLGLGFHFIVEKCNETGVICLQIFIHDANIEKLFGYGILQENIARNLSRTDLWE